MDLGLFGLQSQTLAYLALSVGGLFSPCLLAEFGRYNRFFSSFLRLIWVTIHLFLRFNSAFVYHQALIPYFFDSLLAH